MSNPYVLPNYFYSQIYKSIKKAPEIQDNLKLSYKAISDAAGNQAHIIVGGYPQLLGRAWIEFKTRMFLSFDEATIVNDAVTYFNGKIEQVVKQCQSEGMKIHFVSVEDAFKGHGAYSDLLQVTPIAKDQNKEIEQGEYINRLVLVPMAEDLKDNQPSSYSMHPNLKGAYAYAKCIQAEIERLENERGSELRESQTNQENYDDLLNSKLEALIGEHGIASDETYTANTNAISDKSWTHREGIVSAKLSDLDGDGINELVVVRLIGGKLNPYSENLEFSVYYYSSDGVKSAGTINYFTGDDFTQKDIDSFIRKIGDKSYIFIETDFGMYATDGSAENAYTVLEYSDQKIVKKLRVHYEEDYAKENNYNFSSAWIETTWDRDVENKREIYFNGYEDYDFSKRITQGDYKDSENPVKDYFVDFGLSPTDDYFSLSHFARFFNSDKTEKLFEFVLSRGPKLTEYVSSLKDYTKLDHSSSGNQAEQVAEWKTLYLDYLNTARDLQLYQHAELVLLNDDSTPELILNSGSAMPGSRICWITDGEVQTYDTGYSQGIQCKEKEGLIFSGSMRQGNEYLGILRFDGTDIELEHSFALVPDFQNDNNTKYYVDNEETSKSACENLLLQYPVGDSLSLETSVQDIKSIIKKY